MPLRIEFTASPSFEKALRGWQKWRREMNNREMTLAEVAEECLTYSDVHIPEEHRVTGVVVHEDAPEVEE